jgi:hypothetical protein
MKGVHVPGESEMQLGRVHHHPSENGDGLADDVLRRAEEPCGLLRHPSEGVVTERTMHFMVPRRRRVYGFGCRLWGHD